MSNLMTLVSDYGALLVALLLLAAAVAILPGRVKWYVLTAGLAIIGYEAWMRHANRKLLREADTERERLRGELAQLDGRRNELEQTVGELNRELAQLNERSVALNREREALAHSGDALAARREQLDAEAAQLAAQNRELLQRSSDSEALLARLRGAGQAVDRLDLLNRTE